MLSFKAFLKAMLPPGSLWVPVEAAEDCPDPDFEDGDMEASGAQALAAWSAGNSATLTKSAASPYEGLQSLRVQYNGVSAPYAYQTSLTLGCEYRIVGWARGTIDSPLKLEVKNGNTTLWTHTVSSTAWVNFDETFTATDPTIRFGSNATSSLWAEYDAVTLVVVQAERTEYFDLTLDAIGQIQEETTYSFLKDLAYIRDPYRTPYLSDLEKEYGIPTDSSLTEQERREQLAAIKYAKRGSGSWDDLEDILVTAGFNVQVRTNDPAVNPKLPTLVANELIVNGTESDYWINYLAGLSDYERWNFLFWIVETSSGWPMEYGGQLHTLRNSGDMLFYNDYFTQSLRDYSKFRYENVSSPNVTFSTSGASFGTSGRVLIEHDTRFDNTEGALVWSGLLNNHLNNARLFSKRDASDLSMEVYLLTGPDRIVIESEFAIRTIAYSISANLPSVLAINFETGQTPTLYADGGLVGSFSGAWEPTHYDQDLFVGNDYTFANPFPTTIETFISTDRELTALEHSALATELIALNAPTVVPPTLTDSQKTVLKNLVVKFKPTRSLGLLAITDNKFTFTNVAGYGKNSTLGFSSLTTMDGGRFIRAEEF
jgi:hypothetical protein